MTNILLAVIGTTPQIITEALYALHQAGKKVDVIEVITTRIGKEAIYSLLLPENDGGYYRYLEDYGISKESIQFSAQNITILKNSNNIELNDIESLDDNTVLTSTVLQKTYELTGSNDTTVWFIIAGGRKTMSATLAMAAQIYGREQDRIYHVLVPPEFEHSKNFFYPPPTPKHIELFDKNGQPFFKETKFAQINLINMPFFSIRNLLPPNSLSKPFSDIKDISQFLIMDEAAKLSLQLQQCKVIYGDNKERLMPMQMAIYTFFISKKLKCTKDTSCYGCFDCFMSIQDVLASNEVEAYYNMIAPNTYRHRGKDDTFTFSKDDFLSFKSKINSRLAKISGQGSAAKIKIHSHGQHFNIKYGILLDKSFIIPFSN